MGDTSGRSVRASDSSPPGEARSDSTSKADTSCNALLETVESTCDPLKEAFSSKGGALHHVSAAVGALASLQGAPSQLLNTGIAQIPLLDKMPGMPAAVISAAHLGTPHAHDHPPSDGFPLPSIGGTIGSGCLSVLIGGMPAARVMDLGIAPTCGGLTPYFDIQTGSSNTFIGGLRAARMGVDMTRHCNPMGHAGESGEGAASEAETVSSRARWLGRAGKASKIAGAAVGPASGVLSGADDVAEGDVMSGAMMAAQMAADGAMMLLGRLMGKDPGIEPSMGVLLDGNPTVLIGGFPMPDSQKMWHGIKHGIGKRVRPKMPKWAQELQCEFFGEPISAVTGEVKNDFTDFETDEVIPFKWGRHYCSGWNERDGVLGYGFRHAWQHELRLLRTRAVYTDPRGIEYAFDRGIDGAYDGYCRGYVLSRRDSRTFVVAHDVSGEVEFDWDRDRGSSARCVGLRGGGGHSLLHWRADGGIAKIVQSDDRGRIRRTVALRYDPFGRIAEVVLTDVEGNSTRIAEYGYDALGCLCAYRNALDALSACEYDARRRVARLTDANGYTFFYRYDGDGRCLESHGQDGMWHVQFEYRPGRTIVTEGDGGKWTMFYNEAGTITRVVDPYGGAMEYALGADGRIVEEIDSGGRVLRWLYDKRARNTGRLDRWGNVWPIKDDALNLPNPRAHKAPDTPVGLQWGYADEVGAADRVMLPPELEGLRWQIATPPSRRFGEPEVRRDAAGQLIGRSDIQGGVERFEYDPAGNLRRRRDADGSEYGYVLASWNLRGSCVDPLGNAVRYRYTLRRKVSAIVDANGNESAYTYDLKNRISSVIRHGTLRECYAYDEGDRLIEKRDGAGNLLLRFEVGENGLLSRRILSSGEVHSYEYDARGNFTAASTDRFEITRTYDSQGRRTADKRDGLGIEHAYVEGRLARTVYFERFEVRYESAEGGEIAVHTPAGGIHRMHRGADGRILMQLGNSKNAAYTFDRKGRCTQRLTWREGRTGEARRVQYRYSGTGELRSVTDSEKGVTDYRYDAAHRLVGEVREGWQVRRFEYDPGGNLLSTPTRAPMRYTEGNRLSTAGSSVFRYNDRNHLAQEIGADGRRTSYRYNGLDLLVEVESSEHPGVWTAEYDGLSRRIAKTSAAGRTEYYWDGDRLAAERSPDGALRLYVYANDEAFLPIMFIDYESIDEASQSGTPYFVFHNQVGLPEWIEDEQGNDVWRADDIDPYGTIVVAEGSVIDYCLRFPGHYFDAELGLHYNRFRSYHPSLCRYLQSDPIGQSGGLNLYAYSANPLVAVDVFGRQSHGANEEHDHNGSNEGDELQPGEYPVPKYETTPMHWRYIGEHLPENSVWRDRHDFDFPNYEVHGFELSREVIYASDEKKSLFEISVGEDGKLYDIDGLFDTTNAVNGPNGPGGYAIFVMDEYGRIFAAGHSWPGRVHHSTLSAGKPVAAAGEIQVKDGVIQNIFIDNSGHYKAARKYSHQFCDELFDRGANMKDARVIFLSPKG